MKLQNSSVNVPVWFWVVAALGLAWNLFGVVQFVQSVVATEESLMAMGMTQVQAHTMKSYPLWMTVAFAVGTFGGLVGCFLLFLKKKTSSAIFAVSLVGYILLYIGDITEGVFEAMGMQQVIILTTVVLVAIGLLLFSKYFKKQGTLN